MTSPVFKAKAYILDGCPFSFKYWLFMVEAQLSDRLEVIRINSQDPDYEDLKAQLTAALGRDATFPTVEVERGSFVADSDELIHYYATRHGVDIDGLPAFRFYQETLFPQILALHQMI